VRFEFWLLLTERSGGALGIDLVGRLF